MGGGHGGGVRVEDGAGEITGLGAGEDSDDQSAGEALAAEVKMDEEALDVAGCGVVGRGPVGDAGGGAVVREREQGVRSVAISSSSFGRWVPQLLVASRN